MEIMNALTVAQLIPKSRQSRTNWAGFFVFAFRNFPLVNSHPHAQHAAETAEAAGAQGRFWESLHDALFEHQKALEDENLAQYAAAMGLDARRLIAEVLAGSYAARIREDFRSGARAGVNGTPTLFINGVLYAGPPEAGALLAALTERASR